MGVLLSERAQLVRPARERRIDEKALDLVEAPLHVVELVLGQLHSVLLRGGAGSSGRRSAAGGPSNGKIHLAPLGQPVVVMVEQTPQTGRLGEPPGIEGATNLSTTRRRFIRGTAAAVAAVVVRGVPALARRRKGRRKKPEPEWLFRDRFQRGDAAGWGWPWFNQRYGRRWAISDRRGIYRLPA